MIYQEDLDWSGYEFITKYIYENLGGDKCVEIVCYGNNCKVTGISNVKHQIDVLTKHFDGTNQYTTAIECKYWNKKVTKETIMKVASIIEDAGVDKGIVVSRLGFTTDAISFAKYKNIGIVELRIIEEDDLKGFAKISTIKSYVRRPELLQLHIKYDGENKREKSNLDDLQLRLFNDEMISLNSVVDEFKSNLKKEVPFKIIIETLGLRGTRIVDTKLNKETPINEITLIGRLIEFEVDLGFKPVDQVWMIMKSIFDEKTFHISRKGIINEIK